jgi:circadian clock protein KaiB
VTGPRPRAESDSEGLLRVCLYVAGDSPNSVQAVSNLKRALAGLPEHAVALEFVDILATPERGVSDGVLVTPMLVKVAPAPVRRVLGNLSNLETLRRALGLDPAPP